VDDFTWMIRLPYRYGQTVYHVNDRERSPGIVTGYKLRPGQLLVWVVWGHNEECCHYTFELKTEFDPDFSPTGES